MMYETGIWAEIIEPMLPRFKEAGALREVVSQVWNKEGSFILANTWEYADEKAFVACKELFDEAEAEVAGDRPASTLALDASADDSSKYAMSEVESVPMEMRGLTDRPHHTY